MPQTSAETVAPDTVEDARGEIASGANVSSAPGTGAEVARTGEQGPAVCAARWAY
jgi:hypothetical protein